MRIERITTISFDGTTVEESTQLVTDIWIQSKNYSSRAIGYITDLLPKEEVDELLNRPDIKSFQTEAAKEINESNHLDIAEIAA